MFQPSSSNRTAAAHKVIWVDQIDQVESLCRHIVDTAPDNHFQGVAANESAAPKVVAVDLEGINLSRTGAISIVQIATDTESFLFDISTMKEAAIDELRTHIFENPVLLKVLFDCRQDVDSLYHQYSKTQVTPICDLQVGMVLKLLSPGRRQFLIGMAKCFGEKLRLFTAEDLALKAKVGGKTFDDKGGDPELWARRPVDPDLVAYAALDVKYVFEALSTLSAAQVTMSVVVGSKRRDSTLQSKLPVPQTAHSDFAQWL